MTETENAIRRNSEIAAALHNTLISENELDTNLEPANVVDTLAELARATRSISDSITPSDAMPSQDANGGTVASLTEAVMGVTAGLFAIAEAINRVAGRTGDPYG